MSTRHRYQFSCGHAANATNEEAMRRITIDGKKHGFCPKCHQVVANRVARCIEAGSRRAISPLPEEEV